MKLEEKNRAQQLRFRGQSIKQIAEELDVSKGSVSAWVRNIELSSDALSNIVNQSRLGRERARNSRLINIANKDSELSIKCKREILPFSKRDLWIAGLLVYAGEGSKTSIISSQHIEVANSEPHILRIFINFLLKICLVKRDKIRVRLMLYEDIDQKEAKDYWSNQLGISISQFQNPFIKQSYKNIPLRHMRRTRYGTAHVIVYDVKVYKKVMGWLQAIYEYNSLDFQDIRGVAQFG